MFNTDSIIKEVNIMNKVICYAIVLFSLLVCKDSIFIIFVNLFLLLITKQYPNLFKINIFITAIALLTIVYPQILWISKLGILIIYTALLKKVTRSIELRYILESTLYRFQQKQITYKILCSIYFGKYFKKNLKRLMILKDDYGLNYSIHFVSFIIKKAYYKTKEQMKDFMQINKLRFYNDSKKRTYMEKPTWETWDTNYLLIHIIFALLTCFYGR